MNYKEKKMNNYNIYFIKTKKFKTIHVSLYFRRETSSEDEVYRVLLRKVLTNATNQYRNLDELCRARMNIYEPRVNIGSLSSGLDRTFYLETSFVNEKYTEKGMNEKSIEFALSHIWNPCAQDGAFDKKIFELARHEYVQNMRKVKDNPDRYTEERIWEEMEIYPFKDFTPSESADFALKLNEKDLYEYYLSLFEKDSLDVFVAGDFDEEEMIKIIGKYVKGNFKPSHKNRKISRKHKELKVVIDESDTEQSKLALGLSYEDLTDFERKYVSLVYNNILGSDWNSKLNKVVREENSLCYYIYATRRIPFGISLIYSGIDAGDYEKAVSLIKSQMEEMKSSVSEEDLQRVKDVYNNALTEIEDNPSSILSNAISMTLSDTDSIEDRRSNMNKVTVSDVQNLAKKVNIDVIYLLKGGKCDEKEDI